MVTTMLQRILISTSWTWVFSFLSMSLNCRITLAYWICASCPSSSSVKSLEFPITWLSIHVSVTWLTAWCVLMLLFFCTWCSHAIRLQCWFNICNCLGRCSALLTGKMCTSHEVSNTLSKCSELVLRWVYIKCGCLECLSLLTFAIFASFLYYLYVTSLARPVHLTECLVLDVCRSLESDVCV